MLLLIPDPHYSQLITHPARTCSSPNPSMLILFQQVPRLLVKAELPEVKTGQHGRVRGTLISALSP